MGDELFAYDSLHDRGFADMFDRVTGGQENSPPLYFVFAWASMKLGDPTVLIRLPSLILGTATVPVIYLLGERAADRRAGLAAATITALSPSAVYFSIEARPYATLMFFVACSTLSLLVAVDTRRPVWWLVFSAVSVAALYTHYTALPVLAVQGMWALWAHREQARQVLLAHSVVAGACLAALPVVLRQGGLSNLSFVEGVFPLSFRPASRSTAKLVAGYERLNISDVPGRLAMVLLGIAVIVALVGMLAQLARRVEPRPLRHSRNLVLMAAAALATPTAHLVYSLLGPDIYTTRHLVASFPAIVVCLGALLTGLPRPLAFATTTVAIIALTIGLVRALDPDRSRPPLKAAARYIDSRAGPGDPVVEFVFLGAEGLFTHHLDINFQREHWLYQAGFVGPLYPRFWQEVKRQRRIFVVEAWGDPPVRSPLPSQPDDRFRLAATRVWRGTPPVAVLEYRSKAP